MKRASSDSLSCSFCHKSQGVVAKLISSPSDYPRAYICDECIAVCNSILEDDRHDAPPASPETHLPGDDHPWWDHPLAPEFFNAIEQWIMLETDGRDASPAMAEMRRIAACMMADEFPP